MSQTGPREDIATTHEWAIPCGSLYHERTNGGDAVWAVWQRVPCCGARPDFGYACDACYQTVLQSPHWPKCADCGWGDRSLHIRDMIVRAERIA